MKVELKSINTNLRMSEETIAFTANIYIDGKLVGYAKNHGHGAPTDYDFKDIANRKPFEDYIASLPTRKWQHDGKDYETKIDGGSYFDDLIQKHLKEKSDAKLIKQREKIKSDYASAGFPITLEINLRHSICWAPCKESDVKETIKVLAAKHKVTEDQVKRV